jgi:hypothetical protein
MKSFVKLIYRSNISYFPSKLPVQFYGLPDGKVYVIFARFYEIKFDRTYIEYVFAEHKEFSYDYENERLIPLEGNDGRFPVYNESVDKPEPKVEIIKTFRDINSFAEAYKHLNKKAQNILRQRALQNKYKDFSQDEMNNFTATG